MDRHRTMVGGQKTNGDEECQPVKHRVPLSDYMRFASNECMASLVHGLGRVQSFISP